MRYFYALLCNGCSIKRFPHFFLEKITRLQEMGVIQKDSDFVQLKEGYIIGSIEVTHNAIYVHNLIHEESFVLEDSSSYPIRNGKKRASFKMASKFNFLAPNDIILAAHRVKSTHKIRTKHHKKQAKRKLQFLSLLYHSNHTILATLTLNKGYIRAIELFSPYNKSIEIRASQKSLKALPPQCVLKLNSAGEVLQVLGTLDDAHIDEAIALHFYHVDEYFSKQALLLAESFGDSVDSTMYPERIDLRKLSFCVIDPIDAKDHDDAIYFDSKHSTLYVAIADVSEYVSPQSELDKQAQERGFSLYFPNRVVPMLPFSLSSGICSLKENEDRLALVWKIKLNNNAEIQQCELFEALIRVQASMSYEEVESLLHTLDSNKSHTPHQSKISHPQIASWLISYLPYVRAHKKSRLKKGYDFHTQEISLILDEQACIAQLLYKSHNLAHSIIEESMLLANVASANMLLTEQIPQALFRIHPAPKQERIHELFWDLEQLGFTSSSKDLHTQILEIQQKAYEHHIGEVVDQMIIQSLKKASYSSQNCGHFGLGFEHYTHFTSPIRRYSDLIIHRILKALIRKDKHLHFLYDGIQALAQTLNSRQKHIKRAQQIFYDIKIMRFAKQMLQSGPFKIRALVINEVSHAIALDTIPQAKILLPYTLPRFQIIEAEVTDIQLAQGIIYAHPCD